MFRKNVVSSLLALVMVFQMGVPVFGVNKLQEAVVPPEFEVIAVGLSSGRDAIASEIKDSFMVSELGSTGTFVLEKPVELEVYQQDGYEFMGFFQDTKNEVQWDFEETVLENDGSSVVYVSWNVPVVQNTLASYTITFDANGGAFSDGDKTKSNTTDSEGNVTRYQMTPVLTDYAFDDWYLKDDKGNLESDPFDFDTYKATSDTTLFANWLKKYEVNWTVSGDDNNIGFDYSAYFAEGTSYKDMLAEFLEEVEDSIPEGYAISAWYSDVAMTNEVDFTTDAVLEGGDLAFYAEWEKKTQYTVTFDINGGVDGTAPEQKLVFENENIPALTGAETAALAHEDESLTFIGWSEDKNANSLDDIWIFTTRTVVENTILYAVWVDQNDYYTVKFDANTGVGSAPDQTLMSGGKATMPEEGAFTKEGHTLVGWYQMIGTEQSEWNFNNVVPYDMTLYAIWEIDTYKVRFNTDHGLIEGAGSVNTQTVDWKGKITDPGEITRIGYIFQGWLPSGEGIDWDMTHGGWDFDYNIVEQDILLTAQWTVDPDDGLSHITLKSESAPKLTYEEGEKFNPDGMIITVHMLSGLTVDVAYSASTANLFDFSLDITQGLKLTDEFITVSYDGLKLDLVLVVTEVPVYIYVTGTVKNAEGNVLADGTATAYLMKDGAVIESSTTDASGNYQFVNVGAGDFEIYVFQYAIGNGIRSRTISVSLTGYTQTIQTITLPSNVVSTSVNAGNVDLYSVSGLDDAADYLASTEAAEAIVKISLNITEGKSDYDKNYIQAYKSELDEITKFYDFTLMKNVSTLTSPIVLNFAIDETQSLITIALYLEGTDRYHKTSAYSVYRMHGGVIDKLTTEANEDGEYISFNSNRSVIYIHTSKFSTYALGINAESISSGGDWEDGEDGYLDDQLGEYRYAISAKKLVNGTESSNVDAGGNFHLSESHPIHGTKVTVTPTVYVGYMVDYITAVDREGSSVSVYPNGDGTYYFTQGGSAVTLTVAFTNPPLPVSPDGYQGFYDVDPSTWSYDYILKAAHLGLMEGVGEGLFLPDAKATRGEIVAILYNLAGQPPVSYKGSFVDVDYYAWHWMACEWAHLYGIAEGFAGEFKPDEPIKREELAIMFYNYARIDDSITPILWPFEVNYADQHAISPWFSTAVTWCTNKGIFSGKTGGYFAPADYTNRAEIATCLLALVGEKI